MMKRLTLNLIALFFTAATFAQSSKTSSTSTESSTVSIKNSDHDYSILAIYGSAKAGKIKILLSDALGKAETVHDDLSLWSLKNTYSVTFSAGKLVAELDKDKATGALLNTFERLAKQIQLLLGATTSPEKPFIN